jgi:nitroreductase
MFQTALHLKHRHPPPSPRPATRHRPDETIHSTRAYLPDPLGTGDIEAMLREGFDAGRPGCWGRTAPSEFRRQEVQVYAVTPDAAYRYDQHGRALHLLQSGALASATARAVDPGPAPLTLLYVVDHDLLQDAHSEEHGIEAGDDAGCVVERIYRFCAAAGLGTAVRGLADRRRPAAAFGLKPTQRIVLAQTVGRPQPRASGAGS